MSLTTLVTNEEVIAELKLPILLFGTDRSSDLEKIASVVKVEDGDLHWWSGKIEYAGPEIKYGSILAPNALDFIFEASVVSNIQKIVELMKSGGYMFVTMAIQTHGSAISDAIIHKGKVARNWTIDKLDEFRKNNNLPVTFSSVEKDRNNRISLLRIKRI